MIDLEKPYADRCEREEAFNKAEAMEIKSLWLELKTLDNAREFVANLDEPEEILSAIIVQSAIHCKRPFVLAANMMACYIPLIEAEAAKRAEQNLED